MLTSFFNKHRPVNFLLVAIFMSLFFILHYYLASKLALELGKAAMHIALLMIYLLSMVVVDFVAKKNDLTKNNTYKIFLFAVITTLIPETFLDPEALAANFLVLLALRRIFSLKSQKEIRKKIFDAALWIAFASIFYFWSILFFAVLFLGVLLYASQSFKNWLIPFVGAATVMVLSNAFTIITADSFYLPSHWVATVGFDFSVYRSPGLLISVSLILAVTVWTLVDYVFSLGKKSIRSKYTAYLLLLTLFSALAVIVLTPEKNGSEFIFYAMPFSVLAASFMESAKERPFKESLAWTLLIAPFVLIFV